MNTDQMPAFSPDLEDALQTFLSIAARNGEGGPMARGLLRIGFQAGAAWAFTVVSKDVHAHAKKAMQSKGDE